MIILIHNIKLVFKQHSKTHILFKSNVVKYIYIMLVRSFVHTLCNYLGDSLGELRVKGPNNVKRYTG